MFNVDFNDDNLKSFLDQKHNEFNNPAYIESDPIQIPHTFSSKHDIEIAAFLTATIAWGNRKSIIFNAKCLMTLLDNVPYDFVTNATNTDLQKLKTFVHRTFNGDDCMFFIRALQYIYKNYNGLQQVFYEGYCIDITIKSAIQYARLKLLEVPLENAREKHLANVSKNASCKRINMFLRWMVRKDNRGVDFGLWENIPMSALMIPLDVHSGNVSRKLGLLHRKQNDWKAVEEITAKLREFCVEDPVKYDFALFGLGVFERW